MQFDPLFVMFGMFLMSQKLHYYGIMEYFKNEAKQYANKNYTLYFRFKKHCS